MTQPQTVAALKSAINSSKQVYMFANIARSKEGKTPFGGFIPVYKSHVNDLLKQFNLPTSKWDTTIECFFRADAETGALYIEGFNVA